MGSHYANHVVLLDMLGLLLILILFLLSSVYLAKSILSIWFLVIHLNPPVGRYCDIAHPYRLLASRYIIYFEGAFSSYCFHVLVICFSISVANVRNTSSHTLFNELKHINISHKL